MAQQKTAERKRSKTTTSKSTKPKEVTNIDLVFTGTDWGWEAKSQDGKVVASSEFSHRDRHRAWNEVHRMYPNATLNSE